jgi:hypothetical protein
MKHILMIAIMLFSSAAEAKDWGVDVPVNAKGELSGKSINIHPAAPYPPYYTFANGRHRFETPSKCAKTSLNTEYCRSEMKQVAGRWALAETNETLRAYDIAVESLPCGTKTVIGQIHGANDELVRLYADNTSSVCGAIGMYFVNDIAYGTGKETKFYLKDASGVQITVKQGDTFNYIITPSKYKINVSILHNGVKYTAKDKINPFWLKDKALYYKWGNYYQTKTPHMTAVVSFGKVK